jgi:hypothetical protein
MRNLVPDTNSPAAKRYAAAQKTRLQIEKDLKKLRAQYFRNTRNTEVRQVGIGKLREYTDPALFPTLLQLFEGEGRDVEDALIDHLASLRTDEADASVAWAGVFGKTPEFRGHAVKRLAERVKETGAASERVKWVVSVGLRDKANEHVAAAAGMARDLRLFDAIPMLINAQIAAGGGAGGGGDGGEGALAYILVGQQEAFVAGLTPVVGDSAVGFDPRLGIITTGTYVRVVDAVVITYRTEVNAALIALSTEGWGGQSTASLGWDQKAWQEWYTTKFLPYRKLEADRLAQAAKADAPPTPPSPSVKP